MNYDFTFPDDFDAFMDAQRAAEERGQKEFTCPLCGGVARWVRVPLNNLLQCGCIGCGIGVIE